MLNHSSLSFISPIFTPKSVPFVQKEYYSSVAGRGNQTKISTTRITYRNHDFRIVPVMTNSRPDDLKPVILLTNDDGVCPDTALILPLARRLISDGHDVVVCAPGQNNSACGQRITLSSLMTMRRHSDYEQRFAPTQKSMKHGSLHVFSIDQGTPSDCVIASIESDHGLLAHLSARPYLVVSGINVGQNLGSDILYSGTFAAARQAAMYGFPAIALSLDLFTNSINSPKHKAAVDNALNAASSFVAKALSILPKTLPDPGRRYPLETANGYSNTRDGTCELQTHLCDAFSRGDIVLNVNVPVQWNGQFTASTLDSIWYRSVIKMDHAPSGIPNDAKETVVFRFSGKCVDQLCSPGSDVHVLRHSKAASVTPVSTWPLNHVLALPQKFFNDVITKPNTFWNVSSVHSTRQIR